MLVVVGSCSLKALFDEQVIEANNGAEKYEVSGKLTIPEYQRPYIWRFAEVKRLIDDLICYFYKPRQQAYYLGSIIIHEIDDKLNIIDGQQRITTLAILCHLLDLDTQPNMTYTAPASQQRIAEIINQLQSQYSEQLDKLKENFNLDQLNTTLVVTLSEDDAYRFFETQNTGGIRLSGQDIIKAHHLRATPEHFQNNYAKQWESMGDFKLLIDAILQVRHWQFYIYSACR